MSLTEIKNKKVYGKTAIPTGTYTVTWNYSNKFKKNMPLIGNVLGFSGIRIHAGNSEGDSYGCILLGENKVVGRVINSRATINKFYPLVEAAYKKKEKINIEIK